MLQLLKAIRPNFQIGKVRMAQEFLKQNNAKPRAAFVEVLRGIDVAHEPHLEFKK